MKDYMDSIRKLQSAADRFAQSSQGIWATDTDRERVISVLQEAYTQGCITKDLFEERMSAARRVPITRSQLEILLMRLPVTDLERQRPQPLPPQSSRHGAAYKISHSDLFIGALALVCAAILLSIFLIH